MRRLFNNIFFFLGIASVVVMLLTFDMDYDELWAHVKRAGGWFPLVVGVWLLIYFFNAVSWFLIIRNGEKRSPVGFLKVFKLTVTGFALNYATPCGLMGGEPYRIMELSPILGVGRATSSVILYVMMHIFSHICFWLSSVLLYIIMYNPDKMMWLLLGGVTLFCLAAIYFFMRGYRHGMIVKTLSGLSRLPLVGRFFLRLLERKRNDLLKIDERIAALHGHHAGVFYSAFLFEFTARVLTSLEIYFIMRILTSDISFFDCVLIMAFTSLFGNLFFFSPMQLGAREGGFALSVGALSISGAFGVYAGLITRVREVIWIVVGLLLMKIGRKQTDVGAKGCEENEKSSQTS